MGGAGKGGKRGREFTCNGWGTGKRRVKQATQKTAQKPYHALGLPENEERNEVQRGRGGGSKAKQRTQMVMAVVLVRMNDKRERKAAQARSGDTRE